MKKLLILPFLLAVAAPVSASANEMMINVNVNRVCAAIVNIPYASDNFSDEEWKQFQQCVRFMRQFNGVK
jgi:hypothetical protein